MITRPEKSSRSVLCISTAGASSMDMVRARTLCDGLDADVCFREIDRCSSRVLEAMALRRLLLEKNWDLVYLEGTGLAGLLPIIVTARLQRLRFIVSSGDPIGGFFRVTRGLLAGWVLSAVERQLYKSCSGFVGWTPYLTGAALSRGARRAITVEGGVDLSRFRPLTAEEFERYRTATGIPAGALVCGVVGSLAWSNRQHYCYGLELIGTLKRSNRNDLYILIVGDGEGKKRMEDAVPDSLRHRVVFTGRLCGDDVVNAIGIMNIGFVTQTIDELGSFRLSTKLPEYLACGVPVAMSPIPGFFDYAREAGWALPCRHPASPAFHSQCAKWLDGLPASDIAVKAANARPLAAERFDYAKLSQRFRDFVHSILNDDE
jgi:glycosyltransferase involved in cell wall biosynthesis